MGLLTPALSSFGEEREANSAPLVARPEYFNTHWSRFAVGMREFFGGGSQRGLQLGELFYLERCS